jgi:hypothetical protein
VPTSPLPAAVANLFRLTSDEESGRALRRDPETGRNSDHCRRAGFSPLANGSGTLFPPYRSEPEGGLHFECEGAKLRDRTSTSGDGQAGDDIDRPAPPASGMVTAAG